MIGAWNITSLVVKKPELVCEIMSSRLDIVGLTSTHSLYFGTSLVERGWTLSQSRVAFGERHRPWVGILVSLWLAACTLTFFMADERVCSLHLWFREQVEGVRDELSTDHQSAVSWIRWMLDRRGMPKCIVKVC